MSRFRCEKNREVDYNMHQTTKKSDSVEIFRMTDDGNSIRTILANINRFKLGISWRAIYYNGFDIDKIKKENFNKVLGKILIKYFLCNHLLKCKNSINIGHLTKLVNEYNIYKN